MSSTLALLIFTITYIGVALGRFPGLALDRTGVALLGGIAMVVTGVLTEGEALRSVDGATLALLYALMVVSAQLRLGGFYSHVAVRISRLVSPPRRFLLLLMLVSAGLSAVLVNDIVCLAFTPILATALLQAGLNPIPFLLGLAISSNIGSAATIIGNPQNMLIGQVGRLDFGHFLLWCGPPSLLALLASYGVLIWRYRGRWQAAPNSRNEPPGALPPYDAHQTRKGLLAVVLLIVLFFTPLPREVSALVIAGVLLCSRRMQTRWILELVDWHLITLFIGLFVVIGGLEAAGWADQAMTWLAARGIALGNACNLAVVAQVLSNAVSNVPAVMVLVKFLDPKTPGPWYVLALSSTFAGNLLTIGSIANLIVIEQARLCGISIGFREHSRSGIPVAGVSLLILLGWMALWR